jgi:lipid-A-disaccharide synthase
LVKKEAFFQIADRAIAASGTVSLELAQYNIPHVIAYKTSAITGFLVKLLIKTPFVGLPNILATECIIPELLQNRCTVHNIYNAFQDINKNNQKKALKNVFKKIVL